MRTERKAKILVVDDEENIRKSLKMILEYEGYTFVESGTGEEALSILDETVDIDLVFLDVKLPGMDGLEVLSEVKKRPVSPEVIVISGHGTIQNAVEATKLGAFEFLEKPLHRDRVLLSIRNALNQDKLRRENLDLRRKAEKRYELIGNHPLMKKLWNDILKTAPTNATVLILGESGTGKELIESELFGHEKGSFTGATERKTGKFEQADGGTIFLDEIGDMSLKTQSKVLRVLEEGEVQKVGSNRIIKVDVRVIAATNKDLRQEIEAGKFRDDLFFRLNVVPITSPPLREKKEDIPLLVDYFCRAYADENNFKVRRFSEEALQVLSRFPWKGNVRELRNVVERLLIMNDSDIIRSGDLPEQFRGEGALALPDPSRVKTLKDFRDAAEKDYILFKLRENGWNISQTARAIDTPRSNLYKKLSQFGIKITAGVDEAVAPSDSSEEEGEESPNSAGRDGR